MHAVAVDSVDKSTDAVMSSRLRRVLSLLLRRPSQTHVPLRGDIVVCSQGISIRRVLNVVMDVEQGE